MQIKQSSRSRRVSEQIKRELALLFGTEVKDPRVGLLTISAVETSSDLSVSKVFVTSLSDQADHKALIKVLDSMAGYLRNQLGQRVSLRVVPQLRFVYDKSIEQGNAMSKLIDSVIAEDQKKAQDQSDEQS